MKKPWYRPEIDGLRALAVVVVIFFHAEVAFFSGGYVGVDIFFVISGFLITTIIVREIKNNTFSLFNFFERRVRRIVPALLTVVSVTALIGYKLLLWPGDFIELGKSIFAQSVFLSNVFFLRKINYFAEEIDFLPLLHTWTLSLEEQFYILFPVALLLSVTILKKHTTYLLVGVSLASFLVSVYLVNLNPGDRYESLLLPDIWGGAINKTAGFYLLSARAWEFLAGSILALHPVTIKSNRISEILSVAGLGLLLFAVTQFDETTLFPGLLAILPVAGSLLIIISNTSYKTLLGRMLSLPVVVWIGLLSYSLYLWHWPLFVYAKILYGTLDAVVVLSVLFFSFILSFVTYSLIEVRFRKKNPKYPSYGVVGFSVLILIIFSVLGISFKYIDLGKNIPPSALDIVEANNNGILYKACHVDRNVSDFSAKGPCLLGINEDGVKLSFVLWGDSQAGMLIDAVDLMAKKHNLRGAVFSSNACAPISNTSSRPPKKDCEVIKKLALDFVNSHNIKNVLLVSKWNAYVHQDLESNYHYLITDENSATISSSDSKRVFETNLNKMVTDMIEDGREIYLLKQIPVQDDFEPKRAFYESVRLRHKLDFEPLLLREHNMVNGFTDGVLDQLSVYKNIKIYDPADIFCAEGGVCKLRSENKILYQDRAHLSAAGSILLIESLGLFE